MAATATAKATTIEGVQADATEARQRAFARYKELLLKSKLNPDEAAELLDVAITIRRRSEFFSEDRRLFQRQREAEATAATDTERIVQEKSKLREQFDKLIAERDEAIKAIKHQYQSKLQANRDRSHALSERRDEAARAADTLRTIHKQLVALFGDAFSVDE